MSTPSKQNIKERDTVEVSRFRLHILMKHIKAYFVVVVFTALRNSEYHLFEYFRVFLSQEFCKYIHNSLRVISEVPAPNATPVRALCRRPHLLSISTSWHSEPDKL